MTRTPVPWRVVLLIVALAVVGCMRPGVAQTGPPDDPQDETPDALADPRLRTHLTDARHFVRRTEESYDVIIVDLPDPSTAQLNRFHTREFFGQARKALATVAEDAEDRDRPVTRLEIMEEAAAMPSADNSSGSKLSPSVSTPLKTAKLPPPAHTTVRLGASGPARNTTAGLTDSGAISLKTGSGNRPSVIAVPAVGARQLT